MSGTFLTKNIPQIGTMEMHMVGDANFMYTWNSMMPQGVKSPRIDNPNTPGGVGQGFDFTQSVGYHCIPWSVDNSAFAVPSNITFKNTQ